MSDQKKSFSIELDRGASVDSIFEDQTVPQGTDPFQLLNEDHKGSVPPEHIELRIFESESFSLLNRKYSAVEKLFPLFMKKCSFNELIQAILNVALEAVPSEAGSILELDHNKEQIFFRAALGPNSERLMEVTFPRTSGISGFACENQLAMILNAVEENKTHLKKVSDLIGFHARNLIVFPILIQGRSFGCLELLNRNGGRDFDQEDREILGKITECAALIIEARLLQASLYRQIQGSVQDEVAA